jgi:dienelactone hydrolase
LKDKQLTYSFANKWGTYSATYFVSSNADTVHSTIVFVHGFRARKEWYSWIGKCLASKGYSALHFTVPSNALKNPYQWSDGIRSAIDYLQNKESLVHNELCSEEIGVMGHSMGGLGALIATREDYRIKCTVSLAPAIIPQFISIPKDIASISAPVQLQIGSNDGLIPPETVKNFFNCLSSSQKSYVEIEGGNHIRFMDKSVVSIVGEYLSRFGVVGKLLKDRKATITFEEQHFKSSNSFVEWFDNHLKR